MCTLKCDVYIFITVIPDDRRIYLENKKDKESNKLCIGIFYILAYMLFSLNILNKTGVIFRIWFYIIIFTLINIKSIFQDHSIYINESRNSPAT